MAFPYELDFGLNNFQRQKMLDSDKSLVQTILNLLFMRPGQFPSMPHLGVNIKKYLYADEDSINTESIKNEIFSQCYSLIPYLSTDDVKIALVDYAGQKVLLIMMSIKKDNSTNELSLAFTKDLNTNDIFFNYQWD